MQGRTKKQLASEEQVAQNSPYRMGNWTVTMLKDELRSRQLPISGKKSELIDRLENSPAKTTAAPNKDSRDSPSKIIAKSPLKSLVEDMQLKFIEKKAGESPLKTPLKSVADNLVNERGRSRSRSASPSHRMLTRSRSTSLTRGTFLTWTQKPLTVLGNFILAQVDAVKENSLFFAALFGLFASISVLIYFNQNYRNIFIDQLARIQPVLLVFVDGLLSNLGLTRSEFSQYVSKASRFMFDCSSGNIERNSATGRLRCSAAPLKPLDGGLAGRLVWLTREQFLAWTVGALTASLLLFLVTRKARTALLLQSNQKSRYLLNLAARFAVVIAAFSPFEAVGFISGFSGFTGSKVAALLALKAFIALPLQFAAKVLFAKNQKFISAQINRIPAFLSKSTAFISEFSHLLISRQILNAILYTFICAAAIQVIANNRVYKKLRN